MSSSSSTSDSLDCFVSSSEESTAHGCDSIDFSGCQMCKSSSCKCSYSLKSCGSSDCSSSCSYDCSEHHKRKLFVIRYDPQCGLLINGKRLPTLEVKKDVEYVFDVELPHDWEFMFTSQIASTHYTPICKNSHPIHCGKKIVVFDKHMPEYFYYQLQGLVGMGGIVHVM